MYMRTMDETLGTYVWTQIGSTKMDMDGYQREIDSLINRMSINYDQATIPEYPTARNVVGDLNYLNAALGYDTPNDYAFDATDPYKGTLTTLDPAFVKRRNVIEALNEHEKELGFEYDYGTGKLINLGVDPDHTVNLAEIIKEIGDVSKLELDHIPGDTPEEKKQHIKDHSWTLVDAINAAEEHAKIQDPTTPVDRTKYLDEIVYYREDADEQGWHEPTNPDGTLESKHIYIPRVEAIERTNPGIGDYKTYDLEMAGMKYDPKQAYGPVVLTDVITMNLENLVELSDGIYEYGALLNHYYVNNYVPKPGDPDPFNMTIIGSSLGGAPVTVTQCYDGTNEILFRIGSATTPYVPDESHTITLKYSCLNLVPYGKIDVPHIKIHKESPIDDEWWEEDIVLTPEEWVIPAGGTYLTHEYRMARILSEEAAQPIEILSKSRSDLKIVKETKGSRDVIFQINTTIAPTEDVTCRVKYQIPSEILAQYWLEYRGKAYNLNLCGEKIDILKNGVLEDVEINECTVAGQPLPNLLVGDKYIDFSFVLASGALKHAYLACKDLFDPYVGHEAIIIEYVTDPTDPDYKKNRVKLLINQTQNDRKKDGTSAHDPLNPELITNPTLVQGTDGLYIKDASEDNFGATIYATRNVAQYLADGTGDEVLDPTAANIRKTVKPLDILDFVKYSKSVDPSLKYLYEKDSTTHEHLNKTMIDAFNEIASVKIDTQHIKTSLSATDEEKAAYIEAYRLYTTPDASTTTKNFLGDKIYDYRQIVPTTTLKPDAAGPLYPSQVNDYTLYYLNQREAKGTTPETYNEVGFYLWSTAKGFFPVGGKDLRGKEAIGVEYIPDDTINEVSLIINEYKNDENLEILPDGTLVSHNPVLIQKKDENNHEGLYAARAYRAEVDDTQDPPVVIPRQWGVTTFASEDQVLDAEEKNISVSPLDLHTFVNDSESVADDLKHLYRSSGPLPYNKTVIDAINEVASAKIIDTKIQSKYPVIEPTAKEKKIYSTRYNLYRTPREDDPYFKDFLVNSDAIYDYKEVVQTSTLRNYNAVSNPDGLYPEQKNDYSLYYLDTEDVIGTTTYKVGLYMWRLEDPTDPASGKFFPVGRDPIIDAKDLPVDPDIDQNFFYRTRTYYEVDGRYDISEDAKLAGYKINKDGLHLPDGTIVDFTTVYANWSTYYGTNKPLVALDSGRLFKVTDRKNPTAPITALYYNFNASPVSLLFHDEVNDKWVDVIPKYKVVPDFKDAAGNIIPGNEWEIYVLLESTDNYAAGIYIWDRHDYIPISSKGTAIIDVAELPTVGIEEESFYRLHHNYTIDSRHSLTEQAKKDGYKLVPAGIETATTLIPWSSANIAELTTNGIIEVDTAGEIFVVTNKDVTPEETKVYYNFNSTPVELQFHDPITDEWIEMISKYHAVNNLKTITNPQEWQLYVQLNDTADYKEGIYIWDGGNFKSISSKTEVIIDEDELPEIDIEENSFYRIHPRNKEQVVARYGLKNTDTACKYRVTPTGIESDYYNVTYTYAQVLQYIETPVMQDILETSPTGEIYKIVTDPEATTPEYKLVYKYHIPETTLEFHDEEKERWIDLINKVHFLDTFEGVTGEDYEVYYLTYSYDKYVSGLFYWDGAQFVPFEKYPQSIFYYTKYEAKPETHLPDYKTATPGVYYYNEHEGFAQVNWAFTPEAIAAGYHISADFGSIVAPDGTETVLDTVYQDHTIWEGNNILTTTPEDGYAPFNEVSYYVNDDPTSVKKTMVYNYPGQNLSVNIPTENGWLDVYRDYIAVNKLPDRPVAEKLYYFVDEIVVSDTQKYPKGLYVYRNGKWYKTGSDTIQVVKELPETQQDSFFNIHNEYTIESVYDLTKQAIKDGYKLSVKGIVKPDGETIVWADAVLDTLMTDGVVEGNAEGAIYNVKIGEDTEYKLYYNFNSSPAELHYYEEALEGYTDILNRYVAVNNLEGIPDEERYEWQIYVQLNDTEDHDAGVYIWDSRRFIPISSKGEAIIDVEELPTDIRETSFYRMYNTAVIAKDDASNILRYKVLNEDEYMLSDGGLVKKEDGSVTSWEDVLAGWDGTYGVLFQRVDNGDLFKILLDPDAAEKEYRLVYKFYEPKTLLKFHDEKNDRWIDLLSKFKVVNTFTGVQGEEYELYILTESAEGYAQGMYYFDRDKFVPVNKTANAVMFLDGSKENLPDPIKAEDVVYGWKADITRDASRSWKFTDEAIEAGYTVNSTYTAIVDPDGNETVFDDVYADIDTWEEDVLALDIKNGPFNLVKVTLPDGTQRSTIMYRYIKQDSVSVTDHVKWYDLYSQYVPVNDLDIAEPDGAKLYLLMQDCEDYSKGLYYYNGAEFTTVLESGGIILCEELPTAGIQDKSVYELHTKIEETVVTNYDLTIVEKDAGTYLDVYGLHTFNTEVDPPEENPVVCLADMFANWDEYATKFAKTLPADPRGPIWEYEDPITHAEIKKWSTVAPILPEDRVQFYVYNVELDKWLLLDDSENTINEVRDWDLGKQDSDTLNITWEGTQAEYEALTELNSKTIYFVYDGEAMPAPQQSYNALLDRPTINDVLLQGDLTLQDIGIQTFQYKGAVEKIENLPIEDNKPGDMYSVLEDNSLYAWNGVEWSKVAHDLVDLSKYQTIEDENLMTEAKEVVPAINELYEKMGTPEKITFKLVGGRTGSMLGACHGTFNPSTYTATVSIEITELGIDDEGTFDLGRIQMSTTKHGALIPTGIQALNSVDADAFAGETTGFATTNVGIDTLGNIKCRAIMGASNITARGTHTTEQAIIKTLVLSGTIYITE